VHCLESYFCVVGSRSRANAALYYKENGCFSAVGISVALLTKVQKDIPMIPTRSAMGLKNLRDFLVEREKPRSAVQVFTARSGRVEFLKEIHQIFRARRVAGERVSLKLHLLNFKR
jgi:hypothetical protein